MTPAIRVLDEHRVDYRIHRYEHTRADSGYGVDASAQLGVAPASVFKTLVAELDNHALVVAIVPVTHQLHCKSLARAANAKKTVMADRGRVETSTGYVLGGVSPLGQKNPLATFLDESAYAFETIFISGGRRGLEIEIAADALAEVAGARFVPLVRQTRRTHPR